MQDRDRHKTLNGHQTRNLGHIGIEAVGFDAGKFFKIDNDTTSSDQGALRGKLRISLTLIRSGGSNSRVSRLGSIIFVNKKNTAAHALFICNTLPPYPLRP